MFFISAVFYQFWETNRVILRELTLNLLMALAGVALVSLLLLVHPAAVLIIVAAVAIVDLALFAEMWFIAIPINTISVVNLVMAVGLAVDYALHVVHAFLCARGASRRARVRGTMLGVAAAVLLAALTTILGVVILAASSSVIMRTFFQLLFGTLVAGGIVGLAGVPVVLSLVGPGPCLADDTAAQDADLAAVGAAAAAEGRGEERASPEGLHEGSENDRRRQDG